MTRTANTYTYFLIYIVLNIASFFVTFFAFALYDIDPMAYNALAQLVFFIPAIFVGLKMSCENVIGTFSLRKIGIVDMLMAIFLPAVIGPLTSLLSLIMVLFFPNNVTDSLEIAYQSPLYLSVISVCIIPAVCEELIFRGIIFSGFKNLSLKKACLMGGLMFAIAHFDPQQILYTFVVGVLFCYIVYRTGSIIPGMISHFMLNFSQVLLSRMSFEQLGEAAEEIAINNAEIIQLIRQYFFLAVLSMPILIGAIYSMGRKYGRVKPVPYILKYKKALIIENELIFDFNPQPPFEEKIIRWQLFVIVAVYIITIVFM